VKIRIQEWYHHRMKTAAPTPVDTALRNEWLKALAELEDTLSAWAVQEAGWTVMRGETDTISEDALGEYAAPMLIIYSPDGELRVEPIARNFPGRGIVELYAWPTLRRVHLLPDEMEGRWRVLTDSGIYLRQEWNRDSFMTLANDLIQAQ